MNSCKNTYRYYIESVYTPEHSMFVSFTRMEIPVYIKKSPLAYVYPKEMQVTRVILRRRMKIVRHDVDLKAHLVNTTNQYNLPANKANLRNIPVREQLKSTFPKVSVKNISI